jgi:hypothetical protein
MSTDVARASVPHAPLVDRPSAAPNDAAFLLRPSDAQARDASRFLPTWVDEVRDSGARRVVIDMPAVNRLDLGGFGVLLAKLRHVLRVTVQLIGVGVSEAVCLRSMGLLDGVAVQQRRA